jgi:transcriptional regulator with XRE-family HTH domain
MQDRRRAIILTRIAANVRRIRERRGWTQAELAERAELDLRFVQRVEGASLNFGVAALAALAEALDVTPGILFRAATLPAPRRGRPPRKRPAKRSARGTK